MFLAWMEARNRDDNSYILQQKQISAKTKVS